MADLECERAQLQWEQDNEHTQCSECGSWGNDELFEFDGNRVCDNCYDNLVEEREEDE
jgi:hypothetical protein